MLALLFKWLLNGVAFLLITLFLPGFHMARWPAVLWAALIWGLVNSLVGSLVFTLNPSYPFLFLGVATIIANLLMLSLTVRLVPGFSIRRLPNAFIGVTLLSSASFLLAKIVHF